MKSAIVVGGGIVGLATAIRLTERFPAARVTVIEKEASVGLHQTGHNSGVLHCGLYYKPGSIKARLAVEGIRQMTAFCRKHSIAHEICGKLVVAADDAEVPRLRELEARGTANGLRGLRWLSRDEMREIEPHVGGVAGLRVPEEGIVDYAGVCAAMVRELRSAGATVLTGRRVDRIERRGGEWIAGGETSEWLINCAGLHCDRVAAQAGSRPNLRIVPFRGEYYMIRKDRQSLVRHLIYPVPDPKFPFLGVHFTRMIHGGVEAGPNAVLAFAREGYRKSDIRIADLWDALSYSGTWRFLARYPRMCWAELRRSFSRDLFCASLQRLVPEIQPRDLEPGQAGVRAQALEPSGDLVQDFAFVDGPNAVHVLNAPSPGATASLAIGTAIVDRIS
jgi:L-2-hydroxyglutarate oxidase